MNYLLSLFSKFHTQKISRSDLYYFIVLGDLSIDYKYSKKSSSSILLSGRILSINSGDVILLYTVERPIIITPFLNHSLSFINLYSISNGSFTNFPAFVPSSAI